MKALNGKEFSDWAQFKSNDQCIVEITKTGCAACSYNGRVMDVLSKKFADAGIDIPMYRVNIENKVPYLGIAGYAPVYLYVRKVEGWITEIYTLPTPSTTGNNCK